MPVNLEGLIRELESESPPEIDVKTEPALLQNGKPFKPKVAEPVKIDLEAKRDYINLKSVSAYPMLTKILGKDLKDLT